MRKNSLGPAHLTMPAGGLDLALCARVDWSVECFIALLRVDVRCQENLKRVKIFSPAAAEECAHVRSFERGCAPKRPCCDC